MATMFDQLLALTRSLTEQAEATGETKTAKFGDGTKQLITRNDEIVGWYRVMGIEISVTPKPRQRRARKTTAKKQEEG